MQEKIEKIIREVRKKYDVNYYADKYASAITKFIEDEVLDVTRMTYLLDKEFCKQHPKTANIMIAVKWNSIPNIMSKLAHHLKQSLLSP